MERHRNEIMLLLSRSKGVACPAVVDGVGRKARGTLADV